MSDREYWARELELLGVKSRFYYAFFVLVLIIAGAMALYWAQT